MTIARRELKWEMPQGKTVDGRQLCEEENGRIRWWRESEMGMGTHRAPAGRRDGNESKSRGQPSIIAATIYADPTSTWTTYEVHSPD